MNMLKKAMKFLFNPRLPLLILALVGGISLINLAVYMSSNKTIVQVGGDKNEVVITYSTIPRDGGTEFSAYTFCQEANVVSGKEEPESKGVRYIAKKYEGPLEIERLNWLRQDTDTQYQATFFWLENGQQQSVVVPIDKSAESCLRNTGK